jgi:hypothetical protein
MFLQTVLPEGISGQEATLTNNLNPAGNNVRWKSTILGLGNVLHSIKIFLTRIQFYYLRNKKINSQIITYLPTYLLIVRKLSK